MRILASKRSRQRGFYLALLLCGSSIVVGTWQLGSGLLTWDPAPSGESLAASALLEAMDEIQLPGGDPELALVATEDELEPAAALSRDTDGSTDIGTVDSLPQAELDESDESARTRLSAGEQRPSDSYSDQETDPLPTPDDQESAIAALPDVDKGRAGGTPAFGGAPSTYGPYRPWVPKPELPPFAGPGGTPGPGAGPGRGAPAPSVPPVVIAGTGPGAAPPNSPGATPPSPDPVGPTVADTGPGPATANPGSNPGSDPGSTSGPDSSSLPGPGPGSATGPADSDPVVADNASPDGGPTDDWYSPGHSPGIDRLSEFTLGGQTLIIEFVSSEPGLGFDVLHVDGTATLDYGNIVFAFLDGYQPEESELYQFLQAQEIVWGEPGAVDLYYGVLDADQTEDGLHAPHVWDLYTRILDESLFRIVEDDTDGRSRTIDGEEYLYAASLALEVIEWQALAEDLFDSQTESESNPIANVVSPNEVVEVKAPGGHWLLLIGGMALVGSVVRVRMR